MQRRFANQNLDTFYCLFAFQCVSAVAHPHTVCFKSARNCLLSLSNCLGSAAKPLAFPHCADRKGQPTPCPRSEDLSKERRSWGLRKRMRPNNSASRIWLALWTVIMCVHVQLFVVGVCEYEWRKQKCRDRRCVYHRRHWCFCVLERRQASLKVNKIGQSATE